MSNALPIKQPFRGYVCDSVLVFMYIFAFKLMNMGARGYKKLLPYKESV